MNLGSGELSLKQGHKHFVLPSIYGTTEVMVTIGTCGATLNILT